MFWLTWRQFRAQALIALAALVVLAACLLLLGMRIRHSSDANATADTMKAEYSTALLLSGFAVVLVPALAGAFWGAPLVAREFETGTYRLAWNQSVTRRHWLAVKLGVVTAAAVALTGALSALLTWASSPYDRLVGGRFDPVIFPTRNIVPLGYALFAVVAATTIGLLTRRTVAAMALTLAACAGLQILVPTGLRAHLRPPVTETVAFDPTAARLGARIHIGDGGGWIAGYALPGAWVMSASAELLGATGRPLTERQMTDCVTGDRPKDVACLAAQQAHFTVRYQPADRYWTFQWLEFVAYLLAAALLAGFAFWRIPR